MQSGCPRFAAGLAGPATTHSRSPCHSGGRFDLSPAAKALRNISRPPLDPNNVTAVSGPSVALRLQVLLGMAPSIKGKRAVLSTILALGIASAGCDTFFTFEAVVTDCASGLPLEGVAITVRIDKGVSAAGYVDVPETTDASGKIRIVLNQPDSDVVTIGLDKTGYQPWSHQYDGQPKGQVVVCLTPSSP
jgi:hypothetical protein